MSKKVMFFDVETTGLDPVKHDIIELAYIVEVDGFVKERNCLYIQPFSYENIDPEALKISGHTVEQLHSFMDPREAYRAFVEVLGHYIDKFDRADKFFPSHSLWEAGGFNVRFDLEFLNQFFVKNGDKYFGSYFNWRTLDPRPILAFLNYLGKIDLPKYSLEEACKYFGIEPGGHDASKDIEATRLLIRKLAEMVGVMVADK